MSLTSKQGLGQANVGQGPPPPSNMQPGGRVDNRQPVDFASNDFGSIITPLWLLITLFYSVISNFFSVLSGSVQLLLLLITLFYSFISNFFFALSGSVQLLLQAAATLHFPTPSSTIVRKMSKHFNRIFRAYKDLYGIPAASEPPTPPHSALR